MYLMLMMKVGDTWFPVLAESNECPLPIYVVVHDGGMGGITKEEWIERYKRLSGSDREHKFAPIGAYTTSSEVMHDGFWEFLAKPQCF